MNIVKRIGQKLFFIAVTGLVVAAGAKAQPYERLGDSLQTVQTIETADTLTKISPKKKHQPGKATLYSAVLPGLGQIYNRKYWKVPFVYAGFGALGYLIHQKQQQLNAVTYGYFDLTDDNPETRSYEKIATYVKEYEGYDWTRVYDAKSGLRSKIDTYRNERDTYIIGMVGFYLFNILDANVNAHLIDFDISEDLSVDVVPFATDPLNKTVIPGMQLTFNF